MTWGFSWIQLLLQQQMESIVKRDFILLWLTYQLWHHLYQDVLATEHYTLITR